MGVTETVNDAAIVAGTVTALEWSATGVAVICTTAGEGGESGAEYAPPAVIAPQAAPVQPAPATLQLIARLGLEFAAGDTNAVKFAVVRVNTVEGPDTLSVNELVMVMGAEEFFDASATLLALTEMLVAAGRDCGAV